MDYGSIVPLRSTLQKSRPLFTYTWGQYMTRDELIKARPDLPEAPKVHTQAGGKAPVGPPLHTDALKLAHHEGIHAAAHNEIQNYENQARSGQPLTAQEADHVSHLNKVKDMASQLVTHYKNQGVTPSAKDYQTLAEHHAANPGNRFARSGGAGRVRSEDLGSHAEHTASMMNMQQQGGQQPSSSDIQTTGPGKSPQQPLPAVGGGARGQAGSPSMLQRMPDPTAAASMGSSEGTQAGTPRARQAQQARVAAGPPTVAEGSRPTSVGQPTMAYWSAPQEGKTSVGGPPVMFGGTQVAQAPGGMSPYSSGRQVRSQPPWQATSIPGGKPQPRLKPLPSFERSLVIISSMMKSFIPQGASHSTSLQLISEMQSML